MTALAPNQYSLIGLAAFSVTVLLVGGWLVWRTQDSCSLQLKQTCLSLEYATTPAQLKQGLSERPSMPDNQGMMFILDKTNSGCFWMKGMRFNLDIIWLDTAKRVVELQKNLSPASYPQSYCPASAATYVLEAKAGLIDANQIQLGQQLNF